MRKEDESKKVIEAFMRTWTDGDVDKTVSYLAEDVDYINIPMDPIKGRAKAREFLAPFFSKDPLIVPFAIRIDIKQILADGEMVMLERVDHFKIAGKEWALPVIAVFEVKNGKITVWKDYFDMGQLQPVVTLIDALLKKR
ncbi:MAG: limonene-1,2-epoxide hydrolase family protein [Candidatus Binatia bacterium]